jgi:hypothetical protein
MGRHFSKGERFDDRPYVETFTGKRFYLLGDDENDDSYVCIEDIAFSLSNQPRFNGHVYGWSVLDHSIFVERILRSQGKPRSVRLAGLIHDAHECYIGDTPTPVKLAVPELREFENSVQQRVFKGLGVTADVPPAVKSADIEALSWEFELVMRSTSHGYEPGILDSDMANDMIKSISGSIPQVFIDLFEELKQ